MNKEVIKRSILENMLTPPRWGGKHTEIRNFKNGLTMEVLSTREGQKLVEKAIKELLKLFNRVKNS